MKNLLLIVAVASIFTACDQRDRPYNSKNGTRTSDARETMDKMASDVRRDIKGGMRNMRDRLTETDAERALSLKIRQALIGDNTLSANAKNINVQSKDGVITLTGYVANADEKAAVENKVKDMEGVARVDNKLEIRSAAY